MQKYTTILTNSYEENDIHITCFMWLLPFSMLLIGIMIRKNPMDLSVK